MHGNCRKRLRRNLSSERLESRQLLSRTPQMVENFVPGIYDFFPEDLTPATYGVYFTGDHADFGREVWFTRGDGGSTHRLSDLVRGPHDGDPDELTAVGAQLFFVATTLDRGRELWTSDGNDDGTRLAFDFATGSASSFPHHLTRVGDSLFLVTSQTGTDVLWVVDEEASSAVRLATFAHDDQGVGLSELAAFQDKLLFSAPSDALGRELWISDGAVEGTHLLAEIAPGVSGSDPVGIAAVGENAYFSAVTAEHGRELWSTDGTREGTRFRGDLNAGPAGSGPREFVGVGDEVYFTAEDAAHGRELWKLDTLLDHTELLRDLDPGPDGQLADRLELTAAEGRLFFVATTVGTSGLWQTDGTPSGTFQLPAAMVGRSPAQLLRTSESLFFTAEDDVAGREPRSLDLASDEIELLGDVYPGFRSSNVLDPVVWRDSVLFSATDGYFGQELWISGHPYESLGLLEMLNLTRNHFGDSVPYGESGDWDENGVVDLADLNLVRNAIPDEPSGGHAHPTLDREHDAAMRLVPLHAVTISAVQSGNWSDPATWGGVVPEQEDHVWIDEGLAVTVDMRLAGSIRTLRVDGTLRFATDVSTLLTVDTMVVAPHGSLEIGTNDEPMRADVVAELKLGSDEAMDRVRDPLAIGRGLISHGHVSIRGEAKSAFLAFAHHLQSGDEWLELTEAPLNWRIGDRLLLPGTQAFANEDELREILEIDGNRLRVAALRFDHAAPMEELAVHVANLTRNIVLSSVVQEDIARRAHVMFMHNPDVHVAFASFEGLGRTDKSNPLDDPVLDPLGRLIPGTGANPRSRYPVHFHRTGTAPERAEASIQGSVVIDSPGWGIVNHSSKVAIEDNVVYGAVGAAFASEVGDEVGAFRRNLAVRSVGSGEIIDDRQYGGDFGHQGIGFWFQGAGLHVTDNVVAGATNAGYYYGTLALREPGLGVGRFLAANLPDSSWTTRSTVDVRFVPIFTFANNVAYGSGRGLRFWRHMEKTVPHQLKSVVDGFTAWNMGFLGVEFAYSKQVVLKNVKLYGNLSTNETVHFGKGVHVNKDSASIEIFDPEIVGWSTGIVVAPGGQNAVVGGFLNNLHNIRLKKPWEAGRKVDVHDVTFGELNEVQRRGGVPQYDLIPEGDQSPSIMIRQQFYVFDTNTYLHPDVILFNGQQVFLDHQLADVAAFGAEIRGTHIPYQTYGLTNQQLWEQFGVAVGGAPPQGELTRIPRVNGWIGAPVEQLEAIRLVSPAYTETLHGYRLSYEANGETVVEEVLIDLRRGWNLIVREIEGRSRSFLVYGIGDPGDADGDRKVGLEDLNLVRANLGRAGAQVDGDVNDDGLVDLADLNAVKANLAGNAGPYDPPYPIVVRPAAADAVFGMLSHAAEERAARPNSGKRQFR